MKYKHEDGTPFTKEEFLQKLKIDKEFSAEFGNRGVDQISELIKQLKENPDSRRLIVNAWAVHDLPKMTLPPCHYGFQVYTRELKLTERLRLIKQLDLLEIFEKELSVSLETSLEHDIKDFRRTFCDKHNIPTRAISLMWNQRSVDTFLGLPFNIASYGLLLEIIAKEVNMVPEELIGNLGDVHLYSNHVEQAKEQIGRELTAEERYNIWFNNNYETGMERHFDANNLPDFDDEYYEPTPTRTREPFPLPTLRIKQHSNDEPSAVIKPQYWHPEDFVIENYKSHPVIKAPLSN